MTGHEKHVFFARSRRRLAVAVVALASLGALPSSPSAGDDYDGAHPPRYESAALPTGWVRGLDETLRRGIAERKLHDHQMESIAKGAKWVPTAVPVADETIIHFYSGGDAKKQPESAVRELASHLWKDAARDCKTGTLEMQKGAITSPVKKVRFLGKVGYGVELSYPGCKYEYGLVLASAGGGFHMASILRAPNPLDDAGVREILGNTEVTYAYGDGEVYANVSAYSETKLAQKVKVDVPNGWSFYSSFGGLRILHKDSNSEILIRLHKKPDAAKANFAQMMKKIPAELPPGVERDRDESCLVAGCNGRFVSILDTKTGETFAVALAHTQRFSLMAAVIRPKGYTSLRKDDRVMRILGSIILSGGIKAK